MFSVTGLQAGYDSHIVTIPDITLRAGQSCLLHGPSGSGKTTLLHTFAGLLQPRSGRVIINDTDLYQMTEHQRDAFRGNSVGIIFQNLHLIKSLRVIDNLLLPAYATGRSQNRSGALEVLDRLGIAEIADNPASEISQGQAQRIAIARAILHSPALLLADEPTSSLDDTACAKTIELLTDLARDHNSTLIVASHDSRIRHFFERTIDLGATR